MKTPEEQMRFIIENTEGVCIHKKNLSGAKHQPRFYCAFCGLDWDECFFPSPHSLDDLIRLTEKLFDVNCKIDFRTHYGPIQFVQLHKEYVIAQGYGETKADALRSALVKAIERNK